ncbi:hypothetical protein [Pseudomonas sp. LS-2]|uniref:hypothetical protein n=1 Tax=Pseudomonas sp. LS-2 TaxID=2315859 RepID=UPI000E75BFA8|nr:hypothetical protein [Pseudomonas sp. LS-2]RJX72678.1 hypothetical protein D3M70_31255 [Pseudomonas sp. LS-2]
MSNITETPSSITIARAELDLWADIYCEARVSRITDVSFSKFLEAPAKHLDEAGQASALDCLERGHLPLMPAQVAAKRRLENEWRATVTSRTRNHLTLAFSRPKQVEA